MGKESNCFQKISFLFVRVNTFPSRPSVIETIVIPINTTADGNDLKSFDVQK